MYPAYNCIFPSFLLLHALQIFCNFIIPQMGPWIFLIFASRFIHFLIFASGFIRTFNSIDYCRKNIRFCFIFTKEGKIKSGYFTCAVMYLIKGIFKRAFHLLVVFLLN